MKISSIFSTFSIRCRYPSAFSDVYTRQFLIKHQHKPMRVLPLIFADDTYDTARRAILRLPTASQSQDDRNIRNIAIDSNDSIYLVIAGMIYKRIVTEKDTHHLRSKTFTRTPLPPTKPIGGHRNHSNFKQELFRKKQKLRLRHKPSLNERPRSFIPQINPTSLTGEPDQ